MYEKLTGPTLCGFADFFDDSLGAVTTPKTATSPAAAQAAAAKAAPKKPAAPKTAPKANASGLPRSKTVQQHGQMLTRARVTAGKAVAAIDHAAKQIRKHQADVAARKKVAVGECLGNVEIGADYIEIGADAPKLTPKSRAAVQKHNAALAKTDQATKVLATQAKKAKGTTVALAKQIKNQRNVAANLRKPKPGPTQVRGIDLAGHSEIGEAVEELFDQYYTAIGAAPDPNNPGFLDDGSQDPAYQDPAMLDPSIGLPLGSGEVPMDTGMELPPAPGLDTFVSDMESVGGIAYDGSKGYPNGYCLSYRLFTRETDHYVAPSSAGTVDGIEHNGFVWGCYNDEGPEKGIPWGDDLPPNQWNRVRGRHMALVTRVEFDPMTPAEVFAANTPATNPLAHGIQYGPLIGNPALAMFNGMRVDAKGRMFWFPQEAPDWLTFPLKQAAALTAQAEKKAADDAARVEAAARAKEAADMAAEAARVEASAALAERQAVSESAIAQTQQQTQSNQLLLQQAQNEQQQEAATAQQYQSAGDLLIEEARRRMAAQAAQPAMPSMPGQQLPYSQDEGEEEGGESDYDEGGAFPYPGADMMHDADGEGFVEYEENEEE